MKTPNPKNKEGPGKPSQRHAPAAWTRIAIGDLLKKVGRPVAVESSRSYREIGIRSHCKGIFHKPPIQGKELGSKRVFWVEPGCLVFNIIFAWEQAVAMTTESERGMIASHRFPMYRPANDKLLPEYAYLYFSSPHGKHDLGMASPGGAGRNKTLGQDEFRRLELAVPPIEFQRRAIAAVSCWSRAVDQLSSLIEAKRGFATGIVNRLLNGKHSSKSARWRPHGFKKLFIGANKGLKHVLRGEYLENGRFPVIDQGKEMVAGYCDDEAALYRDVPVILFGDYTREVKFIDFPFACGAAGTQLLQTTSLLDIGFGYHLLKNMALPSLGYSRHMRFLKEQVFSIPEDLALQRHLARVLSAAERELFLLDRKRSYLRQQQRGLAQIFLSSARA